MADETTEAPDERSETSAVPRRTLSRWMFVAVAGLVLAALVAAAVFALIYLGKTPAPDLTGMTLAEATEALGQVGLRLGNVTYDQRESRSAGTVTGQDPPPGTRLDGAEFVGLTISGFPPVMVPRVLGLTRQEAEAALRDAGLVLGEVTEFHHPQIAVGRIITQEPEAAAEAPRGSAVAISLSEGPEPQPVPNVLEAPITDAERILAEAGFGVSYTEVAGSAAKGTVLTQRPSGTESAMRGTIVTLTVSTGIAMIRVPNIEGMSPDEADLKLRQVGLLPERVPIRGPIEADGTSVMRAYRQRPRAGVLMPGGSVVSYHYRTE